MLKFDDCVKMGMLKAMPPSPEQALQSIEKAEEILDDAKASLADERYNAAAILAYVSMLNAARAVLFRDGWREKSHYCITRYLEAKHGGAFGMEMIDLLDDYRETRHEVQYAAGYRASPAKAEAMVEFAGKFLEKVEEILEKE